MPASYALPDITLNISTIALVPNLTGKYALSLTFCPPENKDERSRILSRKFREDKGPSSRRPNRDVWETNEGDTHYIVGQTFITNCRVLFFLL